MDTNRSFEPFVLTPLDHIIPDCFVSYQLSFQVRDPNKALQAISQGITHLASCIPFITGEVVASTQDPGHKNVFEVQPSATPLVIPLLQVKFRTSHTLRDETPTGTNSSKIHETVSTTSRVNYDPLPIFLPGTQAKPVVRFQANVFNDAIILSMVYNHLVFDGTGAHVILELLAELLRVQSSAERNELSADRTFNQEATLRKFVTGASSDTENICLDHFARAFSMPALGNFGEPLPNSASDPRPVISEDLFVFSPEKVDALKEACNYVLTKLREEPLDTPTCVALPSFVSSNNVVTAMLWISISKARHYGEITSDQQPRWRRGENCSMAVNIRASFSPSLPKTYMGNAVTNIRLTVDSAGFSQILPRFPNLRMQVKRLFGVEIEILLPIADLAYRIRSELNKINDSYVRTLNSFLKSHEDWSSMKITPPDILVTSWRHLTTYQLDFGPHLGHIDRFDGPKSSFDGGCVILPAGHSGSAFAGEKMTSCQAPWAVQISLSQPTMEILKKDDLFYWASKGGES
ncbi:hypothetical protein CNMCM5623_004581 [Aspergillus felis]|uniref:Uncharacterized protein n=1 Tax=Aspergillus felis TaxID=1287682 RepID=A0A8H6QG75_9EURO|nr:hypothetical protein CNMCM5623_004581 [Aspergillus felis]